jgi:hypothetical protein
MATLERIRGLTRDVSPECVHAQDGADRDGAVMALLSRPRTSNKVTTGHPPRHSGKKRMFHTESSADVPCLVLAAPRSASTALTTAEPRGAATWKERADLRQSSSRICLTAVPNEFQLVAAPFVP